MPQVESQGVGIRGQTFQEPQCAGGGLPGLRMQSGHTQPETRDLSDLILQSRTSIFHLKPSFYLSLTAGHRQPFLHAFDRDGCTQSLQRTAHPQCYCVPSPWPPKRLWPSWDIQTGAGMNGKRPMRLGRLWVEGRRQAARTYGQCLLGTLMQRDKVDMAQRKHVTFPAPHSRTDRKEI